MFRYPPIRAERLKGAEVGFIGTLLHSTEVVPNSYKNCLDISMRGGLTL
jgi:hypothetical protein